MGTKVGRCILNRVESRVENAWFQRLKLKCDTLLSNIAFNFNLRRYTEVVFVPFFQNSIGVLDTETNAFTTVATTGAAAFGDFNYAGAAVVGDKVVFAPSNQHNVGVLDTAPVGVLDTAFTTIATTGAAAFGDAKHRGAAAVGTKVYFAPHHQNSIGVLDTADNSFFTIAITVSGFALNPAKYFGGVVVGTKVRRCKLTVSKPVLKARLGFSA